MMLVMSRSPSKSKKRVRNRTTMSQQSSEASGSQTAPVSQWTSYNGLDTEDVGDDDDGQNHRLQPLSYAEPRHLERIEGPNQVAQAWRMKERMKTVSVALVLCLNVGVDPPDVVKTSPCARTECWIDPQATTPQKALDAIGGNLQKQYERWQPRARYKQSLDPTLDEVKKLCTSLRRNAKEERVLFHYNGHGVPKPTVNGEIWVFNKSYTQYIPLSVYDLQTWMLSPSIYVYDCSNAGVILDSFKTFQLQREQEIELATRTRSNGQITTPVSVKNCIQLAACSVNELLPMNAELPADLFTSCLTTPIKIALRWYVLQHQDKLVPGISLDIIDNIPGQLNDRRTMLGELNWIFTAITDTIAWNTLPRDLFQKLFRQDLLVASLFRNFLLAERIMRSYNCTPISYPKLPATYQHPMWQAWDLTLDLCLAQLPDILNDGASFQHSPFFAEQLTAFQVWVSYGSELRNPPEQLPIVLQVLLSQVHRLRALDLLGRFLDLGPWAVSLALSVGIFPYVLKLLQSSARELRSLLVFIWAKILAVDKTCQADLVKDGGHKYFLSVLSDPFMPSERKTMAAFVLAMIVNDYQPGQEVALQGNLVSKCLEQLDDGDARLRQWLALALGKVWTSYDAARWCGVRDTAHEKLNGLLVDPVAEVRAAATFALGTFVNNSVERGDHANTIDHGVGLNLLVCVQDGSHVVRQELIVALAGLIAQFEQQFAMVANHCLDEERQRDQNNPVVGAIAPGGWSVVTNPSTDALPNQSTFVNTGMKRSSSRGSLKASGTNSSSYESSGSGEFLPVFERLTMKRVSSASSISGMTAGYGNIYSTIWRSLLSMMSDPHPRVACMAVSLVNSVKLKVTLAMPKPLSPSTASTSAPSSPSNKTGIFIQMGESPTSTSPKPERKVKTLPRDGHLEFNPEVRRGSLNILMQKPSLSGPRRGSTEPRFGGIHESSTDTNLQALAANGGGVQTALQTLPFGVQYSSTFTRHRKLFDRGPSVVDERDEFVEVLSPDSKQSLPVRTDYFNWCCRHFAKPVMQMSDEEDRQSNVNLTTEYRYRRNTAMRRKATVEQQRAGFSRLDEQIFINRNQAPPSVVKFHPYETKLAVADRDGVSIWDWDSGPKPEYFYNHNRASSRITSLEFVNAHDRALLLTAADDGSVRLWKDYDVGGVRAELVTAWQALSDMLPSTRGSGLITDWSQNTSTLLVSGDVRVIRIWDAQKETKIDDILTGADSCVTSLVTDDANGSGCLVVAGCGDGSVRLFDRRLPHHECRVMTLREHQGWVVNVALEHGVAGDPTNRIISASVSGDIRFWDPRFTESVRKIQTSIPGMRSFHVHPHADVLACGYTSQCISVYNQSGDNLSTIKYHDGFMGQRIGPICTLAFHPYFVKLAAGSTDSFISIYSTSRDRRR